MPNFPAGAQRPASDDARAERIEAANDLVRRTLAQHGLMPGAEGAMPDLPVGQGLREALHRAFPNRQMPQGGLPLGRNPSPYFTLP